MAPQIGASSSSTTGIVVTGDGGEYPSASQTTAGAWRIPCVDHIPANILANTPMYGSAGDYDGSYTPSAQRRQDGVDSILGKGLENLDRVMARAKQEMDDGNLGAFADAVDGDDALELKMMYCASEHEADRLKRETNVENVFKEKGIARGEEFASLASIHVSQKPEEYVPFSEPVEETVPMGKPGNRIQTPAPPKTVDSLQPQSDGNIDV